MLKKILNNEYILLIFRIFVAMMFILAAVPKISDPGAFARDIAHYNIIPFPLLNFMAIVLPWMELTASLMLIVGVRLKSGAMIISLMLVVFIGAIMIAMLQGLNINCGCHTKLMSEQVGWKKIFENTALLIMGLVIFFSDNKKLTLESLIIRNDD